MSRSYDCADDDQRKEGVADAASTVRRGELVVLPTDTVYGIGADAFSPPAVTALRTAKGRGRDMPAPVLVGSVRAAQALIEDLGSHGQDLIEEFWPGPLTIVCAATPSLSWDLGDTKGTVAVRMPMHPIALELLKETGPMAVSSANLTGNAPATTAADAAEQLGDSVAVYLDGGPCADEVPSTIVDLTYAVPRVLRIGAIPIERLRSVCGTVIGVSGPRSKKSTPAEEADADTEAESTTAADSTGQKADAADSAERSATGGSGPATEGAEQAATGDSGAASAASAEAAAAPTAAESGVGTAADDVDTAAAAAASDRPASATESAAAAPDTAPDDAAATAAAAAASDRPTSVGEPTPAESGANGSAHSSVKSDHGGTAAERAASDSAEKTDDDVAR
ncbi:tRNA threonylcarbamoyl adenosine modification protein (Sua5/YciO/YrdC/YwlC family) [Murinocardiopsis flavida]|uniref:L-threonylcarbamoyladenylate synthase n=1 Tax=Murinocardiopsis flavida TaxID=645275 RepID=A0A2P8CYD7_9ACTN|nr:tRNA threonylcarbamoyl adenosine modification protein (Sua5/YciO/YrdC/YwlC family) [Murinocardiopsis flavida]